MILLRLVPVILSLVCPVLAAAAPALPDPQILFTSGDAGVTRHRIPNIHVTHAGVVLAYVEARYGNAGDGAPADIVLRRSLDRGQTWGPVQTVVRHNARANLVFPLIAEDGGSGRLFLFYAERPAGLKDGTRNYYLTSDDAGATWSAPHDVTATLVAADRKLQTELTAGRAGPEFSGESAEIYGREIFVFGPGQPIQLSPRHRSHAGRLIVPVFAMKDRVANPRIKRGYGSMVLVSDDHGDSWRAGGVAPIGDGESSEVDVLELDDGKLMLNARQSPSTKSTRLPSRTVSLSSDGGDTWSRPKPDASGIPRYNETHSCLIRYTDPTSDPTRTSRVLFSFPSDKRTHGTILLSYDNHRTWAVHREIVSGAFGYSNMAVLPDQSVLLIYEGTAAQGISLIGFTLDWLTSGRDSIEHGRK
jgi:sialidase-1